jgi:hypothetical protein
MDRYDCAEVVAAEFLQAISNMWERAYQDRKRIKWWQFRKRWIYATYENRAETAFALTCELYDEILSMNRARRPIPTVDPGRK